MTFLGALFTLLAGVLIGLIFYYALKLTGPWGTFWSFLVIVTLAGLAADVWLTPAGPVAWGKAWIPTLFVMLIFALLLAAATPLKHKGRFDETKGPVPSKKVQRQAAIGAFFWVLLVVLLAFILWGVIGEHSFRQPE
ncbi:MAG: hypothetical protein ACOC2M_00685 [bacterium]